MSYINKDGKKVAVIGSRSLTNGDIVFRVLDKNLHKIKMIVSGGAKTGGDFYAQQYAMEKGLPIIIFYPNWYDRETGLYRKKAGFERNYYIINHCDVCIAFFDMVSRGTANSIQIAKDLGKPVKIIDISKEINEKNTQISRLVNKI